MTTADHLNRASAAREATIQLIDQMVSAMNQVVQTGRTDTTITLQHPPIFQGASIVLTQYESSPKEFNVAFLNLTNPDARLLVEMKQNQENLRTALIERGYTVHMITIEPKLNISTYSSTTSGGGERSPGGGQAKGQSEAEGGLDSDVGTGVT